MDAATIEGKVSFVHHEKQYVTIDYVHNGKKKSINGLVDNATQEKLKEAKLIKKIHHYHEGDEVYFTIERSPRGDKMVAGHIQYRFNNALGNLVNRAATDNKFVGYLKQVEDTYFVKETGSYLFFPLNLSPWERAPDAHKLNEPVFFQLENIRNPEKLSATLIKQVFIREYTQAQKLYAAKKPIDATVVKITPHGVYLNVVGDKIQAKIPPPARPLQVNDSIKVIITYLGPAKIVVEAV
ncbi:MAG TPA: hypothetical protein VGM41_19145 [Chitinophagaceae bacterium]|jgi:hypothetical protein